MPDDYQVGYGKPPFHTRFKKGVSGNPKGRPKGATNLKTELMEELQEKILVREDGRPMTVSRQRAMIKSMMAKALQGDHRAANVIFGMVNRLLNLDEVEPAETDLAAEDIAILETFAARIEEHSRPGRRNKKMRKGKARRMEIQK